MPICPRTVCAAALTVALLGLGAGPARAAERPAPDFDADPSTSGEPFYAEQQLATNGQGGFANYRIPALAVTNDGDVLASYDGRPTAIDAPGPNSVLQRRSIDDGTTWGQQTVVAAGRTEAPIEGYSDPSYIVDRVTGNVFNFHVKSYDQGFLGSQPGTDPQDRDVLQAAVSVSGDEGRTWETRVITDDVTADPTWRSRFAASGQGIQLKYGEHAGRLVQQYTIINGTGAFQAVSVYSDDHGASWQVGQPVGTGMDENKTVELSDGRVMLNSRDSDRSGYRKVAFSTDGGVSYGSVSIDRELPDPTNNAAIVRAYPNAPQGSRQARVLLFSNAGSTSQRANGVVRMSFDDGETWPVSRVFQPGGMAYSTLATLPNGNIGLLYEPEGGSGGIRFAQFNVAWLQGVAVSITAPEVTVERGGSGTFDLRLDNQDGRVLPVSSLELELPPGWTADYVPPRRWLPGRSTTLPVTLRVPQTASGGSYAIEVELTSQGRTARGTIQVVVPRVADEVDGRINVTGGTLTNPNPDGYAVGDVLRFSYQVTNLSSTSTTVVPTGNLRGLDPAADTQNCRYRNLPGGADYRCTFPYHVITQADLDGGSFTPQTTWTSMAGADRTDIEHTGERVPLS